MPSKHIDEETWKKIQTEHVNAVTKSGLSIKDTSVLRALINKGLEKITVEDYIKMEKEKEK